MLEAPRGHRALGPGQHAEIAHLGPALRAQRVNQVEVGRALQALGLLVEQRVEVFRLLDLPVRELGRDLDPLPVAVLECTTDKRLALRAMIAVSGVHVVDAVVNRVAHHARGLRLVDLVWLPFDRGQPHATEPQRRDAPVQLAEFAILHDSHPPQCWSIGVPVNCSTGCRDMGSRP